MTTAAIPGVGFAARPARSRKTWLPGRAALFCVPLMLAPPMAMIGPYGITLPEMLVWAAGSAMFLFQTRPLPAVHPVVVGYIALYLIGWLGALYNSFDWRIPIGVGNAAVFYSLGLAFFGAWVGRYSRYGLDEIVRHGVTKACVVAVAVFALVYPFLPVDQRQLLLAPFINDHFLTRLASPRFPGVGINGNSYSFMVFAVFLFAADNYLRKRISWIYPLAALLIIVACASRTVTGLALLAAIALILRYLRRRRPLTHGAGSHAPRTRLRAAVAATGILLLAGSAIAYGSKVRDLYTLYGQFEELIAGTEQRGLKGRQELWATGVERVKLAPALGIPKHPAIEDDLVPLYSYAPHNEFLYFWSALGVAGMLAHAGLLLYLLFRNLRARADLTWVLLYFGIIVQMTFDAVFQGTRVVAFVFILIGLNLKYLTERKQASRSPARAAQ